MRIVTESENITRKINESFKSLFLTDELGNIKPPVCAVCDVFIKPCDLRPINVAKLSLCKGVEVQRYTEVSNELRNCYVLDLSKSMIDSRDPMRKYIQKIKNKVLSPRATYRKGSVSCCVHCYKSLGYNNKESPQYAIANNYYIGIPPKLLSSLHDSEQAYITPMKTHGFCFSYTGGKQRCLEGSLSYFKVEEKSIVTGMVQLEALGLGADVVVILYGKMTKYQINRACAKSEIRVDKVMKAIQWLLHYNYEWKEKDIDLNALREEIKSRKVCLVDNSICVDNSEEIEHSNIEKKEEFRVFFPDGELNEASGGQGNLETYKNLVKTAKDKGYDFAYKCNFSKQAIREFNRGALVNACLLQFPFGRGGMYENRRGKDGSMSTKVNVDQYIKHLSNLSQPQFHKDRFTLILYNMTLKRHMLETATWRVRNKVTASQVSSELTNEDLTKALRQKENNTIGLNCNTSAHSFIKAVDAIAGSIPHSNGATRRARRDAETYHHHFGFPSFFLTVTPDDENSYLVSVYSEKEDAEINKQVSEMTQEEIDASCNLRHSLRIEFPGICALFFDRVLDIVIQDVVGWDDINNCASLNGGLFGQSIAYIAAVEEQGRRTLHAHILIWTKEWTNLMSEVELKDIVKSRIGKKEAQNVVDGITSTALMNNKKRKVTSDAWDHKCTVIKRHRKMPHIVDDQSLRNLRNRHTSVNMNGAFAYCPESGCTKIWTSELLLEDYLSHGLNIYEGHLTSINRSKRLKTTVYKQQMTDAKSQNNLSTTDNLSSNDCCIRRTVVDAAYNFHIHCNSCFTEKDNKQKKKTLTNETDDQTQKKRKKIQKEDECRYRFPKRPKSTTVLESALEKPIKWYTWTGEEDLKDLLAVHNNRHKYDVFQNESCRAISESSIACNTNISSVVPGPLAGYITKYQIKVTSPDDTNQYQRVSDITKSVLDKGRKHASEYSEAMRRVLAGAFAHQKTGIIGSALAAYLTRHKSRFRMSHRTVWCPLRDIYNVMNNKMVDVNINQCGKTTFFECSALHYLCRPKVLESINPLQFYSKYEVVKTNADNKDNLMSFDNEYFTHPSYNKNSNKFKQGVRERKIPILAKIYEKDFPDSSNFNGNILINDTPITQFTESYARQAMLFLFNFRKLEDIQENESYTIKFRNIIKAGKLSEHAKDILKNIQDTSCNAWRVRNIPDDLQQVTSKMGHHQFVIDESDYPNDEEELNKGTTSEHDEEWMETFIEHLDNEVSATDKHYNLEEQNDIPQTMHSVDIRNKGSDRCGFEMLANMSIQNCSESIILTSNNTGTNTDITGDNLSKTDYLSTTPTPRILCELIMTKTDRITKSFKDITGLKTSPVVLEANGSAKSIIDWGIKSGLDIDQRRAFEIFASSFVLTYHQTEMLLDDLTGAENRRVRSEKKLLDRLSGQKQNDSMIALLYGPGGSGKTATIDLLLLYGKEFCENLGNDYKFTSRTITVTALTGVAATLLGGETIHSAVHVNQKKTISPEQIELWEDTRMLIIDEISFAHKSLINKISENTAILKQRNKIFGGLHVIFSGDFRQLVPVSNKKERLLPLYVDICHDFSASINVFIELNGMHRFKKDPEFGHLLRRIRNGSASKYDIEKINTRVVQKEEDLPSDLKYATYTNKDRDAINAALFEKRCSESYKQHGHSDNAVIIFCDELKLRKRKGKYVPFTHSRHFWNNCAENDIRTDGFLGRMDPVLRLYQDCKVMLPTNIDVINGEANGTQALFKKILLKPGESAKLLLYHGVPVYGVKASQIDHILLEHTSSRAPEKQFCVTPETYTFQAQIPLPIALQTPDQTTEEIKLKGVQIPILVNNATTGHKLQGSSVDEIFVHCWRYMTNWPYVILSRVRTLAGLYLRMPLSEDMTNYEMPHQLKQMMLNFEEKKPEYYTETEYKQVFKYIHTT